MKREVIIEYDADHGLTIPVNLYTPVANNVIGELIRCKDCKRFERYTTAPKKYQHDGFCQWWARDTYIDYWCCGAERKEEWK